MQNLKEENKKNKQVRKPYIRINPPPSDNRCNGCGRHIRELKPFGGPGDPLVGDFSGAFLMKHFRDLCGVGQADACWDCRDCFVLDDEEYCKIRFKEEEKIIHETRELKIKFIQELQDIIDRYYADILKNDTKKYPTLAPLDIISGLEFLKLNFYQDHTLRCIKRREEQNEKEKHAVEVVGW